MVTEYRGGVIAQWTRALQDAQAVQMRLDPTHPSRSAAELHALAADAVYRGLDPRSVIAALLAEQPDSPR
jgi:hypothetical protein